LRLREFRGLPESQRFGEVREETLSAAEQRQSRRRGPFRGRSLRVAARRSLTRLSASGRPDDAPPLRFASPGGRDAGMERLPDSMRP